MTQPSALAMLGRRHHPGASATYAQALGAAVTASCVVGCGTYDASSGLIGMDDEASAFESTVQIKDPPVLPAVRINEIMPRNGNDPTNESGQNDWIELHADTTEDVSLAGYILSDLVDNPTSYRLHDGVVIPGGGYLRLWADGHPEAGIDHLDFGLRNEGDGVLLMSPEGNPMDWVVYVSSRGAVYARYPDDGNDGGIGRWTWCDEATPGAPNGRECAELPSSSDDDD